jgi:hypothetical protein
MTVKELITYLQTLDADMPVIEKRFSDYGPMTFESWQVIQAVRMANGDWYMKWSHRVKEWQGELVQCLLFEGN